jgi:RHS repeat-associated protein
MAVGQSSFHRRERRTLTRSGELEFRVYSHEERTTSVFAPVRPDGPAVLLRIEDTYGNAIVFEYRNGRLARVIDTAGRAVNVAWAKDRLASLSVTSSGTGFVVSYEYARNGCLAAVRNPLGHVEKYRYDRLDRMVSTTPLSGAEFVYEYDGSSSRCVSSYGPEGLFEVHLERDDEKHVTVADGEEPRVVVWNELGLAERLMLPDGTLLDEAAYDADGLIVAQANGAGESWQYWYDEGGRKVREMDPCRQATTYEYEGDALVRIIAPDGHVTRFVYDDRGSIAGVEYPWGERYFLRYDERGRLAEATGNLGTVALYEYDGQNNCTAETDALGRRTTYRYDGMGRPVSMRDVLGRETRVTYDARGRRTSISNAEGATSRFEYDGAGHITRVVDALGRSTRYLYSGLNALTGVVGPSGDRWHLEHTSDERVKKIVNPLREEYSFERDLAGRVIAEKTFDGREMRYERNAAGRTVRIQYPDGKERTFAYDRLGRVLRDATEDDAVTFERDARGRMVAAVLEGPGVRHETRFERDSFGRMVGEAQGDRRIVFALDTFGRRTRRVLPNGATTDYSYDATDALTRVQHNGFQLDFERDALGREAARVSSGGLRIEQGYDLADRLVTQRATGRGIDDTVPRPLADRRWKYDRSGRVTGMDDARWGATTYAYDDADRLTAVTRGTQREVFRYDSAGDIIGVLRELNGSRLDENVEVAAGNVLVRQGETIYEYDNRGRRLRASSSSGSDEPRATEYEWDARERLRRATLPDGTVVKFDYDAIGRRVRKEIVSPEARSRSSATDYVWDGPALAMQLDSTEGIRTFAHMPGTFLPLLQEERGEVFTYVIDRMGIPKELLSADGLVAWSATHGAWGNILEEDAEPTARERYGRTVSSPFRLLGQIADPELGLCFTRNRLFDPAVGRWLSPDPLGIGGGTNAYAFDGAPSMVDDPWGLTTDGTGGGSEHDAKWHADRLAAARAARDAKAAELGGLKPPARPAAVTAGYNKDTGEIAVGVSQGGGRGCAEPEVVKQLGGDPNKVQMTEAVRPRVQDPPFKQVPVCPSCEDKYGRGAFPPGTQYKSDEGK